MVRKDQIEKLQQYADTKDARIKVFMTERGSIDIKHGDEHWMSMANKSNSFLSLKRVKTQIDKCAERHKTQ